MVEDADEKELPFTRSVSRLRGLELLGSAAQAAAVQWSTLVLLVVGVGLFLASLVLQLFGASAWTVVGGAGLAACGLAQRLTRWRAPHERASVSDAGDREGSAPPRRAAG